MSGIDVILVLAICLIVGVIACAYAYRMGVASQADRIERLELMLEAAPRPRRRPGQPTNIDAEPSRVTSARRRQGRWKA